MYVRNYGIHTFWLSGLNTYCFCRTHSFLWIENDDDDDDGDAELPSATGIYRFSLSHTVLS